MSNTATKSARTANPTARKGGKKGAKSGNVTATELAAATVAAGQVSTTGEQPGAIVAPNSPAESAPAPAAAVVTPKGGVPLQRIQLLTANCPKRPGTACHVRAVKYWVAYGAAGATTATAMAAGATAADLRWDAQHGFIALLPMA